MIEYTEQDDVHVNSSVINLTNGMTKSLFQSCIVKILNKKVNNMITSETNILIRYSSIQ